MLKLILVCLAALLFSDSGITIILLLYVVV